MCCCARSAKRRSMRQSIARFRTALARAVRPLRRGGPDLPGDLRRPPPPRHGALGAAVPPAMETLPDYLPGAILQPRPSGRGGAGRPPGDDRRPLRRPPSASAARRRTAVPRRCRRTSSISTARSGTRCWRCARCCNSRPFGQPEARPAWTPAAAPGLIFTQSGATAAQFVRRNCRRRCRRWHEEAAAR